MMLRKRGFSYVDWVISLGTFLIAVIFIFILIRPQLEPKDEKETLMFLLEENFYGDTEWTVREVPLFITTLQDRYVGANGFTQDVLLKIGYAPYYSASVLDAPNSIIVSTGNPLVFTCRSGVCEDVMIRLSFYPSHPPDDRMPELKLTCIPEDVALCDALLGAAASTPGLHNGQLSRLAALGYGTLKTGWNFPSSREFAIFVDETALVSGPSPPVQGNVYVQSTPYWKLDHKLVRVPLTMRFQVW